MEGLGIDPTISLIICLFVAGFVQMLKYAIEREWGKVAIILVAGLAGGVAGTFLGLNPLLAVCAGFSASGIITVVKRVGDY